MASSEILGHTIAFLSDVVSRRDLRHHLISTLRNNTTTISNQATVELAVKTLETAISFSAAATRSFSLSLAEKLILHHHHHPLPSFLLSLILTLRHRHLDAAVSLLRIFRFAPSLVRSEIASSLYDRLFAIHLLPVFRWLVDRRAEILSWNSGGYLLSKMSEDQAKKVRELEMEYEEVLDENCRVVAVYLEEVLVSEGGEDNNIGPPVLTLKIVGEGRMEKSEEEENETTVLKKGYYNVRVMKMDLAN